MIVNPKPAPGNAPTTPEERGWTQEFLDLAGSIDDETFVAPERRCSDPQKISE